MIASTFREVWLPLDLSFKLYWQNLGLLLLIAALGLIANDLLLMAAVEAGFTNKLAGLLMLSLVVVAKLTVVVALFQVLRPSLSTIESLRSARAVNPASATSSEGESFIGTIAVALLPFFAYYAAWGFLGDSIRDYSRLSLDRDPFGEHGNLLQLSEASWVFAAIALSWLVRRMAKLLQAKSSRSIWHFVVILCDASWAFIGLYVLTRWKEKIWSWIGEGGPLPYLHKFMAALIDPLATAHAATANIPVELAPMPPGLMLQNLFFYALLPLVWLVMAAIIYGYDLNPQQQALPVRAQRVATRYNKLPKWLRDFINHFVGGYRLRYLPVVNSVRLAFSASLPLLLTLIVAYRAIGWLAAWAWLGSARLIGPHELLAWQPIASAISVLLGPPAELAGGILVDPLRICLLAAVMECATASAVLKSAAGTSNSADGPQADSA